MRNRDYLSIIAGRSGALILSLIVAVTMLPAFAYADSDSLSEPPEIQNEIDAGTEEITYIEYSPDIELPDESTLLEQYLDQKSDEFTGDAAPVYEENGSETGDNGTSEESINSMPRLAGKSRGVQLSGINRAIYDELAAGLTKIADGQTAESRIRVTTYQKGCDFALIIHSLMTDMPYEMYWYDKTAEPNPVILLRSAGQVYVYFAVAEAYRGTFRGNVGSGKFAWYDLNGKTDSVRAAVSNAQQIVSDYAGAEDLDMMAGYRDEICSLTDYNQTAMDDPDEPYGDPWQLIYVFDGDPDTTVVCEGYSKAFQYLCDMSEFSNNTIECYTIYGSLCSNADYLAHLGNYDSPEAYATDRENPDLEGHMWNVLHMDDGRNYIADITNCDTGTAGSPDLLFLRGCTGGSVESGYVYLSSLRYIYDSDALSIYSTPELEMSDSDYSSTSVKVTHYPDRAATCTASGTIEYWMKEGKYYSDNYCKREITKAQTVTAAKGHSWTEWKTVKSAFCTSPGSQKQTCSSCGASAEKSIPATGHSWRVTDTLDYIVHSCGRCGASYSVSKVVADLPKVSIKTPSKATAAFTAKWKKVSTKNRKKIAGIEIQYSTDSSFASAYTVSTAKKTATSRKFKKLARKTTYYVRVRSYKWTGGVKHVSAWSSVKRVKTK